VRDGRVVLTGNVVWGMEKDAAGDAVRNIRGVRAVLNNLVVEGLPGPSPDDVKTRIEAAFRRSAEIDARRIAVEARSGRVVLRGQVQSDSERKEAQYAAWAAPGVTDVVNELVITP
jgi:osmotically-inducible protein OsmY